MIPANSSVAEAIPNTEVRGQICTVQIKLALAPITGSQCSPRLGFFLLGPFEAKFGGGGEEGREVEHSSALAGSRRRRRIWRQRRKWFPSQLGPATLCKSSITLSLLAGRSLITRILPPSLFLIAEPLFSSVEFDGSVCFQSFRVVSIVGHPYVSRSLLHFLPSSKLSGPVLLLIFWLLKIRTFLLLTILFEALVLNHSGREFWRIIFCFYLSIV